MGLIWVGMKRHRVSDSWKVTRAAEAESSFDRIMNSKYLKKLKKSQIQMLTWHLNYTILSSWNAPTPDAWHFIQPTCSKFSVPLAFLIKCLISHHPIYIYFEFNHSIWANLLQKWICGLSLEELSFFSPPESSFANPVGLFSNLFILTNQNDKGWFYYFFIWAGIVARCRSGGVVKFSGDMGGTVGGLLKLRGEVEMCGYKDVEVMWDMLNLSLMHEPMKTARSSKQKFPRGGYKQRFNSRLLFWTNHNT